MKNKYKAIIIDFDNTLVGSDYNIAKQYKVRIPELIEQGYIVSFATGRPFHGAIEHACKALKLKAPQITWGGAFIVDPKTGKSLWQQTIPDSDAIRLIDMLKKQGLYLVAEMPDCNYTTDGAFLAYFSKNIPVKKLDDMEVKDVAKILISIHENNLSEEKANQIMDDIQKEFSSLSAIKFRSKSGYFGIDITSEKATKHTAVLEYMKIMNLSPEEVAGIGDGYNDYPLLTACGFKIAMGDAPQELKDIADFVAPTQKEDGLLYVLNKFF